MKGTILINPYDAYPVQRHKTERMAEELAALGVAVDIVPNDGLAAYIEKGRVHCTLEADFVLYFDKERITARLLEKCGIRLFNSAAATEICDDKLLTHTVLANSGIPMPDTIPGPLCYNPSAAESERYIKGAIDVLGLPIVVKECHGSFGEQVFLCRTTAELKARLHEIRLKPYLLQRYEECGGRDMRVVVIGGRAVCGMLRTNKTDFRSNAALGSVCQGVEVPPEIAVMCERAADIIGLDYCGADVLLTPTPMLCEVNSNAMFEMTERVTGVNVAGAYARHIVDTITSKQKEHLS